MLTLRQFRKFYGSRLIVNIPGLEIPPGITWIKGANGSGKTTLIRCVAGILPFRGNINFQGIDQVSEPVRYRELISFGEAKPVYPGYLTGNDLIRFYARVRKADPHQVSYLCEQFQVTGYLYFPVSTYSEGMMKKISLCLAFLGKPELILLDEPYAFIDDDSSALLTQLVTELSGREGVSFIVSSHISEELIHLHPDHHFMLKDGLLLKGDQHVQHPG